ncbi:hypothetical protein BLA6993_05023 [Burkholderia lata]|uniref:hypothetical protein n=1 Tax=Burkholderia lata (strain ATCC 17760 / DSM 23089 / LMG 22485 / NCIMB 9086 / R18194 / 383) TaxID=482957 RepID=UPI0014540F16|nr:hypothetical protein [Burkholderia lata]VWC04583.1 hypothetical protein BLA6993_05023 [Burkholderia lata]
MLRSAEGISPLANLGQLRRYLTSTSLGQRAGYEAARRALVVLRLTGWISLVGQHRDPLTDHVLLDLAHQLTGAGALIPVHKSYFGQRYTYDGQGKAASLSHIYGLRHRYARDRYEALTGWKALAAGGPSARSLTPAQITAVYLGR